MGLKPRSSAARREAELEFSQLLIPEDDRFGHPGKRATGRAVQVGDRIAQGVRGAELHERARD